MPDKQTLVEKIAQHYAVDLEPAHIVHAGDYLSIKPAHVMTHDNTGAVIPKFLSIGAARVANPRQPVFTLDHNVQDTTDTNLAKYRKIESFARDHGIDFYPAGRGIGHQIICEEGYAWPGAMVVASDSHSNMYGGLGCLGTPIVRTDAAAIWATGRTWWQVPPIAKCTLTGALPKGVTGKDVIVTLCGYFNKDEVLNHAVEFVGDGLASLSLDERLTIANMTTEWGALVGLFPIDTITLDWLRRRIEFVQKRGLAGVPSDRDGNGQHPRLNTARLQNLERNTPRADEGAFYAKELTLDLSTVTPHISGPNHVKVMTSVIDMAATKKRIHKAYLVSCVNSRVQDLAAAAEVVKGKRVAEGVEFYIAPASSEVQAESEKRGDWQTLVDSGAIVLPAGCGPCIGLGKGLLGDNEVGISATNRNFKGRMGSRDAEAYLASPTVVAASAIAGYITGPENLMAAKEGADVKDRTAADPTTAATDTASAAATATAGAVKSLTKASITANKKPAGAKKAARILDRFPARLTGRLVFCRQDNLNTDGIYPGKYTYVDDMTPEQMAAVVMENYDPEFGKIVKTGDILVGGFNFGSGSSREQAATALKYRGIALVIAGSFSETYKRNALNNGFLALECPALVNDLKAKYSSDQLTAVSDTEATVDFAATTLTFDGKSYDIDPIGAAAQELVLSEGLEGWVRERL